MRIGPVSQLITAATEHFAAFGEDHIREVSVRYA